MTERKALLIHGTAGVPDYSAEDLRGIVSALLGGGRTDDAVAPAVGPITRGHGVIHGLGVTPNGTPNATVKVAAGMAVVRGTQNNAQGHYLIRNDAEVSLNVTTADGSNPRRDLVIAQVRDDQYTAFTQDDWVLDIIEGTPATVPADPAVPEDALVLARLAIAAGAGGEIISGGDISALAPLVRATGGITPVTALTDWPSPAEGDVVYLTDVDRLAVHNGSAWRQKDLLFVATGIRNVAFSGGTTAPTGPISYGVTFASAPIVTCTPRRSDARFGVTLVDPPTTTSFNAVLWTSLGGTFNQSVDLHWQAIGPLAT